jgi:hypothetical protein
MTEMAVGALLHDAPAVADLSVGERFYQNFGLSDRPARDEAVFSSKGPGFHHRSFGVGGVNATAIGALYMRESGWEPHNFSAPDALYRWGPEPPPDFGENKKLQ